jgi:hypothetical protein
MVLGDRLKVPQGDTPETGRQTDGLGELLITRVTGTATPLVSVAVIVAVNVEPAVSDAVVGVAARV